MVFFVYWNPKVYKMCRFSTSSGRFLVELKQARVRISRAACRVLNGLDIRLEAEGFAFEAAFPVPVCEVAPSEISLLSSSAGLELILELLEVDIVAISTRRRICFRTPTRSSSTLCSMPAEVSINLASHDLAKLRPSIRNK